MIEMAVVEPGACGKFYWFKMPDQCYEGKRSADKKKSFLHTSKNNKLLLPIFFVIWQTMEQLFRF
jgi:hypothetical protein